jgi:mannose-6-phosphate isomerase-like protein (cupin superfamily)
MSEPIRTATPRRRINTRVKRPGQRMIPPKKATQPTKKKSFTIHYTAPAAGGGVARRRSLSGMRRRLKTTPKRRRRTSSPRRKAYFGNIEKITEQNSAYRHVLFTGPNEQLVVMSLNPGETIGSEVHPKNDQFFRVESGQAKFIINKRTSRTLGPGDAAIIPAGTRHNVINASATKPLKMYTIYSPPHHPSQRRRKSS